MIQDQKILNSLKKNLSKAIYKKKADDLEIKLNENVRSDIEKHEVLNNLIKNETILRKEFKSLKNKEEL